METCKDEAKRLKEELMKSEKKINEYGKEIWLLKKYRSQVEDYNRKKHVTKGRNVKRDYKN